MVPSRSSAAARCSPVEISADILRAAKAHAEAVLGRPVTRAVVTVPAYFDDAARSATRDAARLAGARGVAPGGRADRGGTGLRSRNPVPRGSTRSTIWAAAPSIFPCCASGKGRVPGARHRRRRGTGRRRYRPCRSPRLSSPSGQKSLGGVTTTPAEVKQALATARLAKECLSSQSKGEWVIEMAGTMQPPWARPCTPWRAMAAPLVERTIEIAEGVLVDAGVGPPRSRAWCWSAVRPACRWCVRPCRRPVRPRAAGRHQSRRGGGGRRGAAGRGADRGLGHAAARRDAAFSWASRPWAASSKT